MIVAGRDSASSSEIQNLGSTVRYLDLLKRTLGCTLNRASGLVVVCPLTSKRKPYPFALPGVVDKVEGAVLVDHLKSMDWKARKAVFHSKADLELLGKVRAYVAALLRIS